MNPYKKALIEITKLPSYTNESQIVARKALNKIKKAKERKKRKQLKKIEKATLDCLVYLDTATMDAIDSGSQLHIAGCYCRMQKLAELFLSKKKSKK